MSTPPRSSTASAKDLVEELNRQSHEHQATLLESQPLDTAVAAFRRLHLSHQSALLRELRPDSAARLLEQLPPGDRARALTTVSPERTAELLELLQPDERALTANLLEYPPETVGRMMTPRIVRLRAGQTRTAAIAAVREADDWADTVYTLPVVDDRDRLVGVVQLRDLLAADDAATVLDVMRPADSPLRPEEDQERAARLILTTERFGVPVVADQRLLGIVTIEAAMEVLEIEGAEDSSKITAAGPLGRPYFSNHVLLVARQRGLWLLILAVAASLTVSVMEFYEGELERVVALAVFVPLLIGTGGNAGAQATTTMVRAMAVGEVRFRDIPRVVGRELRVGISLGAMLGILALLPVWLIYDERMAATVALTLVSICTLATLVGSIFPMAAHRVGLDPAIVSAPFIATAVDATGLIIYFSWAKVMFGL